MPCISYKILKQDIANALSPLPPSLSLPSLISFSAADMQQQLCPGLEAQEHLWSSGYDVSLAR